MKNKFFLLSTIVSSCVLAIVSNQSDANEGNSKMPSGGHKCYPGSKCTGDPNLIHKDGDHGETPGNMSGNNATAAKVLRTESVDRFDGTVKSVKRVSLPNETQIQIVVETDKGDMNVIVGPARYVDQSMVKLQSGDKIKVTGYLVKANGEEVIMASRIQKNGNTLDLLDDKRQPLWNNR